MHLVTRENMLNECFMYHSALDNSRYLYTLDNPPSEYIVHRDIPNDLLGVYIL